MSGQFFGYKERPNFIPETIKTKRKTMTVCSSHAKCRGSWIEDGQEMFVYVDDSRDSGQKVAIVSCEWNGNTFSWKEPCN